jgi:hypothetical protein
MINNDAQLEAHQELMELLLSVKDEETQELMFNPVVIVIQDAINEYREKKKVNKWAM